MKLIELGIAGKSSVMFNCINETSMHYCNIHFYHLVVDISFALKYFIDIKIIASLSDCVEKIDAQRILGYALFKEGKDAKLTYPLEKYHSDIAGRSFHNGKFIQRMREKAATISK